MNTRQYLPGHPAAKPPRAAPLTPGRLLAYPAIGLLAVGASEVAAVLVAGLSQAWELASTDGDPDLPANIYVSTHATDPFLTSHPLQLAGCLALIAVATVLAAAGRRTAAIALLCAAVVIPWYPVLSFTNLGQLADATPG